MAARVLGFIALLAVFCVYLPQCEGERIECCNCRGGADSACFQNTTVCDSWKKTCNEGEKCGLTKRTFSDGTGAVKRFCAKEHFNEGCHDVSSYLGFTERECYCGTRLCNGAPSQLYSMVLLSMASLLLLCLP